MKPFYSKLLAGCYIIITLIACTLFACKDYRRTLPNGYELVRTSAREVSICYLESPHESVVSPHIDKYTVIGDLVIGHVSIPDISNVWYKVTPGYFILDTKRDNVHQGLEKAEWLELLKGHGISKEPELKRSTRFDRNY